MKQTLKINNIKEFKDLIDNLDSEKKYRYSEVVPDNLIYIQECYAPNEWSWSPSFFGKQYKLHISELDEKFKEIAFEKNMDVFSQNYSLNGGDVYAW